MILKLGATVLTTVEQLMIQTLVTAHDGPMYRRKMTLDKYGDREFGDQLHYDAARFSSWNRNPDVEAANDMSDVAKLLGTKFRLAERVLWCREAQPRVDKRSCR